MPIDPNRPVFIGMTEYDSLASATAINEKTQVAGTFKDEFDAFVATFDFECYAWVVPDPAADAMPINLSGFPNAMDTEARLELAVRVPSAMNFDSTREAFVNLLNMQPGVVGSREFDPVFTIPVGNEGTWAIGTTVYRDQATLDAVTQNIGMSQEAGAYFSTFSADCYFLSQTADNSQ